MKVRYQWRCRRGHVNPVHDGEALVCERCDGSQMRLPMSGQHELRDFARRCAPGLIASTLTPWPLRCWISPSDAAKRGTGARTAESRSRTGGRRGATRATGDGEATQAAPVPTTTRESGVGIAVVPRAFHWWCR